VVLDCPGKDSIRLWPLPLVDPCFERRKATLYLQVGEGGGGMGVGRKVSDFLSGGVEEVEGFFLTGLTGFLKLIFRTSGWFLFSIFLGQPDF